MDVIRNSSDLSRSRADWTVLLEGSMELEVEAVEESSRAMRRALRVPSEGRLSIMIFLSSPVIGVSVDRREDWKE